MEEETGDQKNNRPWLYKKGQSGNPSGRPVGSKSMKTYVKEKLASMTDEEREEFLEGVDKKVLWEMSEGKAKQDIEANVQAVIHVNVPSELATAFNIDATTNPETSGSNPEQI